VYLVMAENLTGTALLHVCDIDPRAAHRYWSAECLHGRCDPIRHASPSH
jgi:hypothetical protein